jgi:hypothetical protein
MYHFNELTAKDTLASYEMFCILDIDCGAAPFPALCGIGFTSPLSSTDTRSDSGGLDEQYCPQCDAWSD